MRIAQLVIAPVARAQLREVPALDATGAREGRIRLDRRLTRQIHRFAARRLRDCSLIPHRFAIASGAGHAAGVPQGRACHRRRDRHRAQRPQPAGVGQGAGRAPQAAAAPSRAGAAGAGAGRHPQGRPRTARRLRAGARPQAHHRRRHPARRRRSRRAATCRCRSRAWSTTWCGRRWPKPSAASRPRSRRISVEDLARAAEKQK